MELHKAKLLKKQKNNDLDLTTLTQLPYLNAVVKEVLRVAPPVGAGYRKALQTFEIDVSTHQEPARVCTSCVYITFFFFFF